MRRPCHITLSGAATRTSASTTAPTGHWSPMRGSSGSTARKVMVPATRPAVAPQVEKRWITRAAHDTLPRMNSWAASFVGSVTGPLPPVCPSVAGQRYWAASREWPRPRLPTRAFLAARFEQLDHLGDALGPHLGPPFGPIDPAQVRLPVELGQRVEERARPGRGLQGRRDVGGQVIPLGPLGGEQDLDLIARTDPAAAPPRRSEEDAMPLAERLDLRPH